MPTIQHAALGEFTDWMSGVSGAAVKVKLSPGETSWNNGSCMVSGGQGRLPGGSRLLNQDLNPKEG